MGLFSVKCLRSVEFKRMFVVSGIYYSSRKVPGRCENFFCELQNKLPKALWFNEAKLRKLFGCPPPPAACLYLHDHSRQNVFTVQKYTTPNFQNSKKKFFFSLRILIF